MIKSLWLIWIMFFYVFFCYTIKANHFFIVLLYWYIWFLLFYIVSLCTFHLHIFLLNLLILFWLNANLLTSSVNTFCFSLLNLYCDFNINLLFFMNFWFSQRLFTSGLFFLIGLFYSQVDLLLSNAYSFQI